MKCYVVLKPSVLLVSVLISINFYAQPNNSRFENLTSDLDLTGSFFTKIQQDRQGFLWISSIDGDLYKYDGYETTKYKYKPFDPHSVPQNMIYTFLFEKNDAMWIGTPEGLAKFDRRTETFTRYDSTLIPGMPNLGNVSVITEDAQGNLWIGNFEGKLWRYNRKRGEFLPLTAKFGYKERKSLASDFHETFSCIYKDKKGSVWIGGTNGLYKLNIQTGKPGADDISFTHYEHAPAGENSLTSNNVVNIYEDRTGILWIATFGGGLNSLDPQTGKFRRYVADPSNPAAISSNNLSNWGTGIVEDFRGNLWIATENGLNKLNKERSAFTSWFQDSSNDFGLRSNYITTLALDAGGNLFVGTGQGLQSLTLGQKAFGLLQHDPKDNNSISDNEVLSVVEDNRWRMDRHC